MFDLIVEEMNNSEAIVKMAKGEKQGRVLRELLDGGMLGKLRMQCMGSGRWYNGLNAVWLRNARFDINHNAQNDMMQGGQRTGHASVVGQVAMPTAAQFEQAVTPVTYRPGVGATFMCGVTMEPLTGAAAILIAIVEGKQRMLAAGPDYTNALQAQEVVAAPINHLPAVR